MVPSREAQPTMTEADAGVGVLVLADRDPVLQRVLGERMEREGHRVLHRSVDEVAAFGVDDAEPAADLVVLALAPPRELAALVALRAQSAVPIVAMLDVCSSIDGTDALDAGADDYVDKPFAPRLLAAKVRALLRRTRAADGFQAGGRTRRIQLGSLEIDRDARLARLDGEPVALTRREFDLLVYLALAAGRTVTRAELLRRVWGSGGDSVGPATVTEHVRRLRSRLDAANAVRLVTVRGSGYRLDYSEDGAGSG